jgi:tetratricopeptide (TPR) repeat protein/tRNA A-37 threonylcarbamoyl transferase component Bud32/TolB-like protein
MAELVDQLKTTLSGSYTLDHELGGGGMSRVFLADELRLGRKVVVKVLSPELAAGISAERFEREIRLAASLQQANIVPLLSAGDTGGLPFYTMPFVEGESLRARMAHAPPLQTLDIVRILGDVARALQYAHDRGIVHRDIKPDNILLSGGTAVVTDFGIAKALSASRTSGSGATLTQIGTSMGTPAYMAPEQAAGDPDTDARADIYALGCVAYELLAGHPPFHDRSPQRVLAAHMSETPRPIASLRPDAPPALSDLITRCLAKDASDRPQSAAEVILALNVVTSGWGVPSLPPVLRYGPAAFRRALLGYAVAVVGVAVIAQAATITIGLPDWVLPGALAVMALGLPIILFTGYVQRVARRVLISTPALTPGGGPEAHGTMATIALRASPHVSWQRTTRGGIYALGAFAAVVAAFMVMRAFGIGPAGSLLASGRLNQRDAILVADFATSNTDSSVGRVVAEGVRANLSQSPSIKLFSPASVSSALARMQLPPTTRLDASHARQLASREGIKAFVTGDVTGLGNGFVVALRLISTDSGSVLASYQTTVDGPSQLVSGVDDVTRRLRGKIGESLRSVQASPPLEQVTTASYDALKAYTEATRLVDEQQDYQNAIPLLRQAVAIDTGFAMAWRKLGVAYGNSGYPQSAAADAMTRAFQLRARLADQERYMTEASYYFFGGPGNDRAKAAAALQALLARGDSTSGALNNLGLIYISRREFPQAEKLLYASMRAAPNNTLAVTNLLNALIAQGKFAESDSVLAASLKRSPNNPNLLQDLVVVKYAEGDYDRAVRLADSVDRATPSAAGRMLVRGQRAFLAMVGGRVAEGARFYNEYTAMQRQQGLATRVPVADSIFFVVLDEVQHDHDSRLSSRLDAILNALPLSALPESDRPYANLGIAYAMAGRVDRARGVLAQMAQIRDTALRRGFQSDAHQVQAEIALAENRPRDAIAEFRRADSLPDGPMLDAATASYNAGRAFDRANEPDSAIAMYEQYLHASSIDRLANDALMLPVAQRRLGELYEARGDRARAALHYAAFIDLWKGADPDLQPQVAEVRQRVARLGVAKKS